MNNVFQWEKPQLRTEPVQEGKDRDLGRFYYQNSVLPERMEVKIYLVCWNIYMVKKRHRHLSLAFLR